MSVCMECQWKRTRNEPIPHTTCELIVPSAPQLKVFVARSAAAKAARRSTMSSADRNTLILAEIGIRTKKTEVLKLNVVPTLVGAGLTIKNEWSNENSHRSPV